MSSGPHQTTQPSAPSKRATFLRRLRSTLVLWTIILAALFSGKPILTHTVFIVVMTGLALVGLAEFYGLVKARRMVCFPRLGLAGGALLMVVTFLRLNGHLGGNGTPGAVNDFEAGFLILFVLGLGLCQLTARDHSQGLQAIAMTLLGLMYVPWLLNFIQKIHYFPGVNGTLYILYFIFVTKFSDTGAYVVGSLFGKHKMIPRVSPGKTWEGFVGAIVVPVGASMLFAHFAGGRLAGMNLMHAALLGVILSLGAVTGDLIESMFKREAGVKDSGSFFPGIGGILDLLDSLLFNAPLMYLYLRHVLTHPKWESLPAL